MQLTVLSVAVKKIEPQHIQRTVSAWEELTNGIQTVPKNKLKGTSHLRNLHNILSNSAFFLSNFWKWLPLHNGKVFSSQDTIHSLSTSLTEKAPRVATVKWSLRPLLHTSVHVTITPYDWSQGKQLIVYQESQWFPKTKLRETSRFDSLGKTKLTCFPRDQSLGDMLHSTTITFSVHMQKKSTFRSRFSQCYILMGFWQQTVLLLDATWLWTAIANECVRFGRKNFSYIKISNKDCHLSCHPRWKTVYGIYVCNLRKLNA